MNIAPNTKGRSPSNLLNDYHLLAYDDIDSTNEEARRLALAGASHGAVIWAKRQSAGRGRMGRSWVSPEGNLYVSVLLAPECGLETVSQLSFITSLAAVEAVAPLLPDPSLVQCKWPNDVLCDGKKLGGILLESFQSPDDGRMWAVAGLGINIDNYPEETQWPATSLREQGVEIISAKIVLSRFIYHFIARYDEWKKQGFTKTRRAWKKHQWGVGDPVRVVLPKEEVQGVCKGIDDSGGLIIALTTKKRRILHAGDVFPHEPSSRKAKR